VTVTVTVACMAWHRPLHGLTRNAVRGGWVLRVRTKAGRLLCECACGRQNVPGTFRSWNGTGTAAMAAAVDVVVCTKTHWQSTATHGRNRGQSCCSLRECSLQRRHAAAAAALRLWLRLLLWWDWQLMLHELAVDSVSPHQLIMRTAASEAPLIQHHHHITIDHR
jgi:hypothetical protein